MVLAQPFGILRRQHRDCVIAARSLGNELLAMASDSSAAIRLKMARVDVGKRARRFSNEKPRHDRLQHSHVEFEHRSAFVTKCDHGPNTDPAAGRRASAPCLPRTKWPTGFSLIRCSSHAEQAAPSARDDGNVATRLLASWRRATSLMSPLSPHHTQHTNTRPRVCG